MAVLYVAQQGATLRKEDERICVASDGQTIATVPVRTLERVVLLGNIHLTTPMVAFLLHSDVDCVFCSSEGRYRGRLVSTDSAFGELRRSQLVTSTDPVRTLSIARNCACAKLRNQRTLLLRNARSHCNELCVTAAEGLRALTERAESCATLNELRGYEGQGAVLYFQAFRDLLQQDLGFVRRARRPPTDPVNSLLSLGYTLLSSDMLSAISIVGLDPHIGFLHAVRYSSPSLALDLSEEFRPVLVDGLVLQTLNSHVLTEADFERRGDPEGVYLCRAALPKFIAQYEKRLLSKVTTAARGEQVTYRRCLELQARALAATVQGKSASYRAYLVK